MKLEKSVKALNHDTRRLSNWEQGQLWEKWPRGRLQPPEEELQVFLAEIVKTARISTHTYSTLQIMTLRVDRRKTLLTNIKSFLGFENIWQLLRNNLWTDETKIELFVPRVRCYMWHKPNTLHSTMLWRFSPV